MAGRTDPRRPVHADPDVALAADPRLPRVQTHPHLDLGALRPGVRREIALRVDRGLKRVLRRPEGDEERVTLRIDFLPAVGFEGGPQDPLMLAEHVSVAPAELFEQAS